jgi:signal transduction histidine kinase/HAMP domain-containing protein/ActR/RegA family two-component response regulator
MKLVSSVRFRMVFAVCLAMAPGLLLLFLTGALWWAWVMFALAIWAAWYSAAFFVLPPASAIRDTAQKLAEGELSARTGVQDDPSELGELAREFDLMATSLQKQAADRETDQRSLMERAHQQTVIAALGQLALVSSDVQSLASQAATFIAQTLDADLVGFFELDHELNCLVLRAGTGWRDESLGRVVSSPSSHTQLIEKHVEPLVARRPSPEPRFTPLAILSEHGVVSGVEAAVGKHDRPDGILAAYSTRTREFGEEDLHFLQSVANVLAMVSERKRTEPQMQKLAAFAQFNPNPVMEFDSEGRLTYFNEAAERMAHSLGEDHPEKVLPANTPLLVGNCLATGQSRLDVETRPGNRVLNWSFYPVVPSQVVHGYVEDLTEKLSLEAQLRQSQKMESVGLLAAGVAHDFNNILTVIQGHAGLLLKKSTLAPEVQTPLQTMSFAAERAAGLTRQLLMFSRRNVIQTRALDLHEVVANMANMLKRLLGETITLEVVNDPPLPPVEGDVGMMEQVILNLAVNARDAMPRGGRLVISTSRCQVTADDTRNLPEARPGTFVRLDTTDTGCGMDAATISRIFEPFFTTKEPGKGTGLGLATVYGIVKQHEGWVEVASAPGRGTTFSVFLPVAVRAGAAADAAAATIQPVRGGNESLLLVEDEAILQELASMILEDLGYRVRTAATGHEALKVFAEHGGQLDLVVTDMIMPGGMSGRDLAERLWQTHPKLKVVYTSGYSGEEITDDRPHKGKFLFVPKPYTQESLARAIRECLDT